jgi:RNA polymerase sigma factor (sigma-70 family)
MTRHPTTTRQATTDRMARRAREIDDLATAELAGSPAAVAVLQADRRGKGLDRQERLEEAVAAGRAAGDDLGLAPDLVREASDLRWQIVQAHRREVSVTARLLSKWGPADEVESDVLLGFYAAACRYDPAAGVQFWTYARWWGRARVMREAATRGRLSNRALELLGQARAWQGLAESAGLPITTAELAEVLGLTPAAMDEVLVGSAPSVSLEAPAGEGQVLGDLLGAEGPDPTVALEVQRVVAQVDRLTPRERTLIRLRYGLHDGRERNLAETARIFGLSRERIRQIEIGALEQLRDLVAPATGRVG